MGREVAQRFRRGVFPDSDRCLEAQVEWESRGDSEDRWGKWHDCWKHHVCYGPRSWPYGTARST